MNAQIRQLDQRLEILVNDLAAGRVSQAEYEAKFAKILARAEQLLARQEAKAR